MKSDRSADGVTDRILTGDADHRMDKSASVAGALAAIGHRGRGTFVYADTFAGPLHVGLTKAVTALLSQGPGAEAIYSANVDAQGTIKVTIHAIYSPVD